MYLFILKSFLQRHNPSRVLNFSHTKIINSYFPSHYVTIFYSTYRCSIPQTCGNRGLRLSLKGITRGSKALPFPLPKTKNILKVLKRAQPSQIMDR